MLAAVELTTSSTVRVTENAVASTLTVIDPATGSALASTKTFYLRGDGSDDDLLEVLRATIESHGGSNTYTATLTFSTDPAAAAATVTITRATGSNNFQLNLGHAGTTIDPAWFGFAASDTANDGSAKSGTLSPSVAWVSPQPPKVFEERKAYDVSVNRARSGRVRTTRRGGPYNIRDVSFELCDSRRVHDWDNTSDPHATFASFLEEVGDGTDFELHLQTVTSTTVDALTVYTRLRDTWRMDEQTSEVFTPVRLEPALSLYAFALVMHGYGETDVEAVEATPDMEDMTHWSSMLDTAYGLGAVSAMVPDKSGFLFNHPVSAVQQSTAWYFGDSAGEYTASSLNGHPGTIMMGSGHGIQMLAPGSVDPADLSVDAASSSSILAEDFTIQHLCRFSDVAEFVELSGRVAFTFGGTNVMFARRRSDTGPSTLVWEDFSGSNRGGAPGVALAAAFSLPAHLLTYRCIARVCSVYLDDDFTTPVGLFTFPSGITAGDVANHAFLHMGNGAEFQPTSAPIHHEIMVWNVAKDDAALQRGFDYLVSQWGAW